MQSQVPPTVAAYFKRFGIDTYRTENHPIITQAYSPGRGWVRYPIRKRVSRAWAIKHLRPEGITSVQLTVGTHHADFQVSELISTRSPR